MMCTQQSFLSFQNAPKEPLDTFLLRVKNELLRETRVTRFGDLLDFGQLF